VSTTIPAAVALTLGRDEFDELRWLAGQLVADMHGRISSDGGGFDDVRRFHEYARALGALGMDIDYDWSGDGPAERLTCDLADLEPLIAGAQDVEEWIRGGAADPRYAAVADRLAAARAILVRLLEAHEAGR
jgi:hypothetical protein